jgi:hypothetical protein
LEKDMKIASGIPVPGLPLLVEVCFNFFCRKCPFICFLIKRYAAPLPAFAAAVKC